MLDTYDWRSQKNFSLKEKRDNVAFRDNSSVKILEKGVESFGIKHMKAQIVFLVNDLKHNPLNVGKMCDQGYNILFNSWKCEIREEYLGRLVSITTRRPNEIYVVHQTKWNKTTGKQKSCKDNNEGNDKNIKFLLSTIFQGEQPKINKSTFSIDVKGG